MAVRKNTKTKRSRSPEKKREKGAFHPSGNAGGNDRVTHSRRELTHSRTKSAGESRGGRRRLDPRGEVGQALIPIRKGDATRGQHSEADQHPISRPAGDPGAGSNGEPTPERKEDRGNQVKGSPQDYFERYISELAYRRKPTGVGFQPHYYLGTPTGTVAVDLSSYERIDRIPEQVRQVEQLAGRYQGLRVPYVLVLWKGGGLPGPEHQIIQEVLAAQRPYIISAVALLEGRPGHERLSIFHNPYARIPMVPTIFSGPRDKHYTLLKPFDPATLPTVEKETA